MTGDDNTRIFRKGTKKLSKFEKELALAELAPGYHLQQKALQALENKQGLQADYIRHLIKEIESADDIIDDVIANIGVTATPPQQEMLKTLPIYQSVEELLGSKHSELLGVAAKLLADALHTKDAAVSRKLAKRLKIHNVKIKDHLVDIINRGESARKALKTAESLFEDLYEDAKN
ncbi:hypothetical protein HQ545_05320 [Candidatus Woesearchaeota archaeon]|nr:hypothetical protein [Candidatus Woesearchaeota archaeon]